jgi:hypothetical protein
MSETEACRKCGKELDTQNPEKWCKACRAAYQREYNATKEGRAFLRGVKAMQRTIVGEFGRPGIANVVFSGADVAFRIAQMPGPELDAVAEG